MLVSLAISYTLALLEFKPEIPKVPANHKLCTRCNHTYPKDKRLTPAELEKVIFKVSERPGSKVSRSSARGYVRLAKKESTFYHRAKAPINKKTGRPISTAYGLYGFLNGTWAGTGIKKTDCHYCQVEAAGIYIKNRYGNITNALAHHQRKGWY